VHCTDGEVVELVVGSCTSGAYISRSLGCDLVISKELSDKIYVNLLKPLQVMGPEGQL